MFYILKNTKSHHIYIYNNNNLNRKLVISSISGLCELYQYITLQMDRGNYVFHVGSIYIPGIVKKYRREGCIIWSIARIGAGGSGLGGRYIIMDSKVITIAPICSWHKRRYWMKNFNNVKYMLLFISYDLATEI